MTWKVSVEVDSVFIQLRFSSYLRNEAKGNHFFEISTNLSQNKAVRVAKNIKFHYNFTMHGD